MQDVDKDGLPDVVTLSPTEVACLCSSKTGPASPRPTVSDWWLSQNLALGDFTADKRLDAAVLVGGRDGVRILPGNGEGQFGNAQDFPVRGIPLHLAAGDLTGDGRPECHLRLRRSLTPPKRRSGSYLPFRPLNLVEFPSAS